MQHMHFPKSLCYAKVHNKNHKLRGETRLEAQHQNTGETQKRGGHFSGNTRAIVHDKWLKNT